MDVQRETREKGEIKKTTCWEDGGNAGNTEGIEEKNFRPRSENQGGNEVTGGQRSYIQYEKKKGRKVGYNNTNMTLLEEGRKCCRTDNRKERPQGDPYSVLI